MPGPTVCISAADGSGGGKVARLVAGRLGLRLIDEALIQRAAEAAGVDPEVMVDAERRRSLLERLVESVGLSADAAALAMAGVPREYVPEPPSANRALRDVIRTAIEEAAAEGGLVIFGHAASVALGRRDNVLRVLVTAPEDLRCRRIGEERGLAPAEAAKAVALSDRGRADYLKRFYGVATELPTHYDLVVSTDRLQPEEAAAVVVAAALQVSEPRPAETA